MNASATSPTSVPPTHASGLRALVVEDNEINMLTYAGFEVTTANDGQQAIDAIAHTNTPFDLVLMDMQMPVMDGLQATRAIRQLPQHAHLPIVAMTANAMAQDRQRCLDAGMNDFVAKPIDPDLLWAALLRWIPPRQGYAPPPASTTPDTQPPEPVLPQPIEGLDTALGLRRCMGKTGFYRQMLLQFAQQQAHTPALIQQAMDQQQWPEARRLAHSLKGVAGNLGATHVQSLAEALEHAISDNPNHLEPHTAHTHLQALQPALNTLLQHLLAALATPHISNHTPEPPRARTPHVHNLCTELQALLESGDIAAQDWIQQHQPTLSNALGPKAQVITDAVLSFDFDLALQHLTPLLPDAPP